MSTVCVRVCARTTRWYRWRGDTGRVGCVVVSAGVFSSGIDLYRQLLYAPASTLKSLCVCVCVYVCACMSEQGIPGPCGVLRSSVGCT